MVPHGNDMANQRRTMGQMFDVQGATKLLLLVREANLVVPGVLPTPRESTDAATWLGMLDAAAIDVREGAFAEAHEGHRARLSGEFLSDVMPEMCDEVAARLFACADLLDEVSAVARDEAIDDMA